MIPLYNALKSLWSRANDWAKATEPRAPVPSFASAEEAAGYIKEHIPYTGDPLNGAADFWLHPERLQAAIERGYAAKLAIDCDDVATFAYQATRGIGPRTLYTLRDGKGWAHHVILVGRDPRGPWAIDTNGYRRLPDLQAATLCRVWSEIYGPAVEYVEAVATPYPF